MNTLISYSLRQPVAVVLIAALLSWAIGFPLGLSRAFAAQITSASDTLSDTDVSVGANHTIQFTTPTGIAASGTLTITFPAGFDLATNSVAFGDIDLADDTVDVDLAATPSGTTWGAAVSGQVLTFTNGSAAVAAGSVIEIQIGTNADSGANQIINPGSTGSQEITFAGADSGATRVFIIDDITVTATVATTFTFTISGVASGQTNANGESGTTDVTTTSTTIPWGTLADGVAKVARQDLAVTTNAAGGFSVTVFQDQNLLSANGADIDIFRDGTDGAPQAWAAPAGTLGTENTYGHEGITSEDATLAAGDTFGSALYDAIGTSATPLPVFYHTGPADGSTADQGATKIGYKIEISALQEAANDYTQTLTYVATPTF